MGSAAGALNESFGGFNASLRGILDAIFSFEQAMADFSCFLNGLLISGFDNVVC